MTVAVQFTGPWEAVKTRLVHSKRWLNEPAFQEMRKLGKELHKEFKKRIRSNPPPKLAPSTVLRKRKKKSRSPNKRWRETGWLAINAVSNPQIVKTTSGGIELRLAISEAMHPGAGMSALSLFTLLELGTKTTPARPVLAPFMKDIQNGKVKALEDFKTAYLQRILDFDKTSG